MFKKVFIYFWSLNLLWLSIILASPFVYGKNASKAVQATPVGYWQTLDGASGKPRSVIQISMDNNVIYGKIIKIYSIDGKPPNIYCSRCQGKLHNAKLVGLKILWGLKQQGNKWGGGHVLNPKTGKIYKCQISIVNNGKALILRAYRGIFSRTKTWKRWESIEKKAKTETDQ